jgi:hypothetical protein
MPLTLGTTGGRPRRREVVTCVLTVVSLMYSSRPISALESPRVMSSKTSSSREVRVETSGGGTRTWAWAKCRITRRVTAGESSASPAATVRTAASSCSGGSSLSTNPLAPARSASKT